MNKAELIAEIARVIDMTKVDAGRFLDGMIEVVRDQLKKGDSIVVSGFCTISVDERSARDGRHPQTGATIKIPAKKVVKIKPGNLLKEAVQR